MGKKYKKKTIKKTLKNSENCWKNRKCFTKIFHQKNCYQKGCRNVGNKKKSRKRVNTTTVFQDDLRLKALARPHDVCNDHEWTDNRCIAMHNKDQWYAATSDAHREHCVLRTPELDTSSCCSQIQTGHLPSQTHASADSPRTSLPWQHTHVIRLGKVLQPWTHGIPVAGQLVSWFLRSGALRVLVLHVLFLGDLVLQRWASGSPPAPRPLPGKVPPSPWRNHSRPPRACKWSTFPRCALSSSVIVQERPSMTVPAATLTSCLHNDWRSFRETLPQILFGLPLTAAMGRPGDTAAVPADVLGVRAKDELHASLGSRVTSRGFGQNGQALRMLLHELPVVWSLPARGVPANPEECRSVSERTSHVAVHVSVREPTIVLECLLHGGGDVEEVGWVLHCAIDPIQNVEVQKSAEKCKTVFCLKTK